MDRFLNNRYTKLYFKIINVAKSQNRTRDSSYQLHHIVPKSIGGTNEQDNLVLLTYKEHRACHCLLIKMQKNKQHEIKMRHAYGFFNKFSRFNGPRYKKGKDNIFASDRIKKIVKERMTTNNPMKNPDLQRKRVESWKRNRKLKGKIPPRVLKDKFITPFGVFKTKKSIIKILGIPEWTVNTIYDNLNALPTSNGRKSKNIEHLKIDYTKTWKENGFDIINKYPL